MADEVYGKAIEALIYTSRNVTKQINIKTRKI